MNYEPNATYPNAQEWTESLATRYESARKLDGRDPMGQNLLNLAKNGRSADIEQIARNLAKQQGIDFDKEFAAFKEMLGL